MNTITIQSQIMVLTDGDQSLVITDVSPDAVNGGKIPVVENSISIKAKFKSNKPLFCHVFPSASLISYDFLLNEDRLVDEAINFKPD